MKHKKKLIVSTAVSFLAVLGLIIYRRYCCDTLMSDDDSLIDFTNEDSHDDHHGIEYFSLK